jgi:hypothetical protein
MSGKICVWTSKRSSRAHALKSQGMSHKDISSTLSREEGIPITQAAVENHLGRSKDPGYVRTDGRREDDKIMIEENRRLREENKILSAKVESAYGLEEMVVRTVEKAIVKLPKRQLVLASPIESTSGDEEEACLVISDSQMGSCIKPEHTAGLSTYSWDEFLKRSMILRKVTEKILRTEGATTKIKKLNIFMVGDMVEGELIFPNQLAYLDQTVMDQVTKGAQEFHDLITYLSGLVDKVEIYATPGNHGRASRKGEGHPISNWDYAFYVMMSLMLRDNPKIKIHISKAPVMALQMMGKNILVSHGDETVGWSGLPWYGMQRDTLKQMAMLGIPLDLVIKAHHHQQAEFTISAIDFVANGSWQGATDFSVRVCKSVTVPVQKIFGFHRKWGRTWTRNIVLADINKLKANPDGIFTPSAKMQNGKIYW